MPDGPALHRVVVKEIGGGLPGPGCRTAGAEGQDVIVDAFIQVDDQGRRDEIHGPEVAGSGGLVGGGARGDRLGGGCSLEVTDEYDRGFWPNFRG